ncbi:MAG: hypothetical protein QME58_11195 [Bacteroidota bacterium]|nr:hypothetical protein [Bacteroidota bacterium]
MYHMLSNCHQMIDGSQGGLFDEVVPREVYREGESIEKAKNFRYS